VSVLRLEIIDNQKVCQDQIKVVKDAARKRERWFAIFGTILGFAARGAL